MFNFTETTSTLPVENPIILDIWTSFGAILVGIVLSSIVYGISGLQAFIYSLHCNSDPALLKVLIAILWVADTANQTLMVAGAWNVLIKQYGRIAGLFDVQALILHRLWVSHIVIVIVQVYFARRVYLYGRFHSKKYIMRLSIAFAPIIGCLILFEICSVIVYTVRGIGKPIMALSSALEIHIGTAFRCVSLIIDTFIACAMVFLMSRTTTYFQSSKKLILRLLIISVGSGTLTAVCAAIIVALLNIFPDDLTYTILEFPLCSLYFSALLVNLNSRAYVKNGTFSSGDMFDSSMNPGSALVIRGMSHSSNVGESGLSVQAESEANIRMDEPDSPNGRRKV